MHARIRVLSFVALFSIISLAAGADASEWRFEFLGATTTGLSNPHDIKLSPDGRHLFVSDVGNDRVVLLDAGTLARVDAFGGDTLGHALP